MTKKFYDYWDGYNAPENLPDGLEYRENSQRAWKVALEDYERRFTEYQYRWPVSEYIWRTNRYCEAFGIEVPGEYEVVGFGHRFKEGEYFLNTHGNISGCSTGNDKPIVRKKQVPSEIELKELINFLDDVNKSLDAIGKLAGKIEGESLRKWKGKV